MGRDKIAALIAEAIFLSVSAYAIATPEERRYWEAKFWQGIERGSMEIAKRAANLANRAYRNYQETVSI